MYTYYHGWKDSSVVPSSYSYSGTAERTVWKVSGKGHTMICDGCAGAYVRSVPRRVSAVLFAASAFWLAVDSPVERIRRYDGWESLTATEIFLACLAATCIAVLVAGMDGERLDFTTNGGEWFPRVGLMPLIFGVWMLAATPLHWSMWGITLLFVYVCTAWAFGNEPLTSDHARFKLERYAWKIAKQNAKEGEMAASELGWTQKEYEKYFAKK